MLDNEITVSGVLNAKTKKHSAEIAKSIGLSPYIINNNKPYYYTNAEHISKDSLIALPIGDIFTEFKAITKAGIKQMHNIKKQFNIGTMNYKSKNHEYLLFYSDKRLSDLPYDQLCIKSQNDQNGLFLNLKHSYAVIPPSPGYKIIEAKEMSYLPDKFIEYILAMHGNTVVSGNNYA